MKEKPSYTSEIVRMTPYHKRAEIEPYMSYVDPATKQQPVEVWSPDRATRTRHIYLPGQSGSGKTSLMTHLALSDIGRRDGPVIVIDPKGGDEGLVERVIRQIPKSYVDNVLYISRRNPVPIDMLSYRDAFEKTLIKDDIASILQRFVSWGTWGSTLQGILNALIPTLLEAQDTTFLDIVRFLESVKRREQILEQVSEDRQEWWKENRHYIKESGPLATRMSNFKEPPLSTILDTKRGEGLNIADVINNNEVLLVDTSPSGNDGFLLGALVMSRVQQAIFRRERHHHYPVCTVYADEFHRLQTSGFSELLTEGRSFGISLCLANQHPGQIKEIWDDVKGIWTYVLFRMDGEHAAKLKWKIKELPEKKLTRHQKNIIELLDLDEYEPPPTFLEQIPSLPAGHAIFVSHTGETRRVVAPRPLRNPPTNYVDKIIQHTRDYIAQKGKNRPGDNSASQNKPNLSDLKDDGRPTLKLDILSNETKAPDPRKSGEV